MQPDLEKQDVDGTSSLRTVGQQSGHVEGPTVKESESEDVYSKEGASIHAHISNDTIRPIPDGPHIVSPSRTIASSTHSCRPNVVPRSQRRGLLARFALIPEVERPYEYENKTKWTITLLVASAAAAGPMGSAIFYRECHALVSRLHH